MIEMDQDKIDPPPIYNTSLTPAQHINCKVSTVEDPRAELVFPVAVY